MLFSISPSLEDPTGIGISWTYRSGPSDWLRGLVPPYVPVLYGQFQTIPRSYPRWVTLTNRSPIGRNVWNDPLLGGGRIECCPRRFSMIIDYGALGDHALTSVWIAANNEPRTVVEVTEVCSGEVAGYLVLADRDLRALAPDCVWEPGP